MKGKIIFAGSIANGFFVTLRYPQTSDVHALLRYNNVLSKEQTFMRMQGEQLTLQEEKVYLHDMLAKITVKQMVRLFAFSNGHLIGSSGVILGEKIEKHVGSFHLSVAKEYRGKGIGTVLMHKTLDEARITLPDLKIVKLGVFATNTIAQNMYKKYGFVQYGFLPQGVSYKGELVGYTLMYKNFC